MFVKREFELLGFIAQIIFEIRHIFSHTKYRSLDNYKLKTLKLFSYTRLLIGMSKSTIII